MQALSGACKAVTGLVMESFYAVRIGRKTGVFRTWAECQKQVKGFSGAKFKKFPTLFEARNFVIADPSTSSNASFGETSTGGSVRKRSRGGTTDKTTQRSSKRLCQTQLIDPLPLPGVPNSSNNQLNVVYSDGCCTKNGRKGAKAGIGVYWGPDDGRNVSERLKGKQTNQRAEIWAAIRALESAKKSGLKSVEIRTDSMYTINGVNSWIKGWKRNGWKTATGGDVQNREDFERLDKICQELHVKWIHVPGHSGIHGNEEADALARQGANKPQVIE